MTFWGFAIDEKGQSNPQGKVRATIRLDDHHHLAAHGVTDVFDREGKPIDHQFSGPFQVTDTRVEVELL